MPTFAEITEHLDTLYPRHWAEPWDRVGLVTGRGETEVAAVHLAVDPTPATVAEARRNGANLIVTHHPLLLRGVSSLDPAADFKGELIHTLIENGMGLYCAHTNADVANPGVSDALARLLHLHELEPLHALSGAEHTGSGRGIGRVGHLRRAITLGEFSAQAAAVLPRTSWGLRVAGDVNRPVRRIAVSGGAGDSYLNDAAAAEVEVYLTADLRHHPASEAIDNGGPALIDAAHWATERPWLDLLATQLADVVPTVSVSDIPTDPWNHHVSAEATDK
ncbi:Nif3-like dinuclear metal center hexameric protein [Haloglycomyces albus]|uniref:Nif3-like dinuclear metal center hexameric protein n=1 Tax=Haloglycomyces albus TaxID=526067 RepID=UPI0004A48FDA|nr:Nif3-like dinuclear metal center hexameric protein [Haloglycomyces albus]